MGSSTSKIDRIHASRSSELFADLLLDKETGMFFARVGGERVSAATKEEAVKKTKEALSRVTAAAWREVILIRVRPEKKRDEEDKDEEPNVYGHENGKPVFCASCSLTYLRAERAKNPLQPKETIEREHREDFEARVRKARENGMRFDRGDYGKRRADEAEKEMRQARNHWSGVVNAERHFSRDVEHEIPYSEEAWAGVRLIAEAVEKTQANLNAFVRGATPAKLLALSALAKISGTDVFLRLPEGTRGESPEEPEEAPERIRRRTARKERR